jgi:hypothetical protein
VTGRRAQSWFAANSVCSTTLVTPQKLAASSNGRDLPLTDPIGDLRKHRGERQGEIPVVEHPLNLVVHPDLRRPARWSPQKLLRRANQSDEAAIKQWRTEP